MTPVPVRPRRSVLALLCAVMFAQANDAIGADIGPDSTALEAAVLGLIGDAVCTGHEQCRTIAFGAKACGGPQAYLPWSTLRTNEAALQAAAARYAAARRAEVKDDGAMASNCALVADPGAHCAAQAPAPGATGQRRCRLRSSRPGGGASRLAN